MTYKGFTSTPDEMARLSLRRWLC